MMVTELAFDQAVPTIGALAPESMMLSAVKLTVAPSPAARSNSSFRPVGETSRIPTPCVPTWLSPLPSPKKVFRVTETAVTEPDAPLTVIVEGYVAACAKPEFGLGTTTEAAGPLVHCPGEMLTMQFAPDAMLLANTAATAIHAFDATLR